MDNEQDCVSESHIFTVWSESFEPPFLTVQKEYGSDFQIPIFLYCT